MKTFIGTLKVQLLCGFINKTFSICIVANLLFLFFTSYPFIFDSDNLSVYYLLCRAVDSNGIEAIVIFIIPLFPFALSYVDEFKQKVVHSYTIRSSVKNYIIAKLTSCFLSSFSVVFISYSLYCIIMSLFFPIFSQQGQDNLLYFFKIAISSLCAGMFSVLTFFVGTFSLNRYSATITPTLIYLLVVFTGNSLNLPFFILPTVLLSLDPIIAIYYKTIGIIDVYRSKFITFGNIYSLNDTHLSSNLVVSQPLSFLYRVIYILIFTFLFATLSYIVIKNTLLCERKTVLCERCANE